jgi:DNA-binding CsgD family transcriptional regulator
VLHQQQLQSTVDSYSTFVDSLGQGIVCLSPDLRVRWANKRARHYLRTHLSWEPNTTHLPKALHQWLTKSRQRLGGVPHNFSIRSEAGALLARVLEEQKILYLFLECSEQQQHTFDALKTFGLTNREAEVLGWIARGKSNEEAAAILGMGLHTVKKHLERIYTVLGAANRTEAALKAHAALGGPPAQ